MLTVTAAIILKESKILIARRAPPKHLAGFWELPGGTMELGETAEECLKRELFEEMGVKVKVEKFFMENFHNYGERQILLKAFYCELLSGEIILKDHDQIAWVEKSDYNKYNFAPADIPIINSL
jgi:8-oxo-dGTP diphosphatase